ncbi:uncharacterized protein L203_105570 [Cryptococcus depauperatus CBS 7841]|uniref:Large ribosomal subunit protein mL44 n=1 Tax=Cryptococcus depauperatus CBS 7841 TaxID=1295531 RepID=A0A1E3IEY0_9TREE|nr:hypothetical protein L203_03446 [Cryptococcus depauperatus CBS 7841]
MSALPARLVARRSAAAARLPRHVQLRPLFPTRKIHQTVPRLSSSKPIPFPLPPSTALSALASRLSLSPSGPLQTSLLTCLTHPSYFAQQNEENESEIFSEDGSPIPRESNELLAALGNSLLGLFASEHLSTLYPYLPTKALQNAVTAYVGPSSCISVGRGLGVAIQNGGALPEVGSGPNSIGLPIRWSRTALSEKNWIEKKGQVRPLMVPVAKRFKKYLEKESEEDPSRNTPRENYEDVITSTVRAFVGLIYQEQGIHSARTFVHAHFLSRALDLSSTITPKNPMQILSSVVSSHLCAAGVAPSSSRALIQPRILAQTGVASPAPLFLIGLFLPSGIKLAEGHGSSKSMAQHRAAVNALHSIFLMRGDQEGAQALGVPGLGRPVGEYGEGLPSSAHEDKVFKDGKIVSGHEEGGFEGSPWGGKEVITGSRQ